MHAIRAIRAIRASCGECFSYGEGGATPNMLRHVDEGICTIFEDSRAPRIRISCHNTSVVKMHSQLPFDVLPAYSRARDASIDRFTRMICEQLGVTRQRLQFNGQYTFTTSNLELANEDTLHFWQVAGLEQLLEAVCNSMVLHSRADALSARLVIANFMEDWVAEF